MKIEESFEKLDIIINKLEDKNTSLEDAFKAYEEGVGIIKECNASLDKVQKEIIVLQNLEGTE
jgi:exodeoxyribonuclease VII small subunit